MATNNSNFWFHKYPYTDFHELDLSWCLDTISDMKDAVDALAERVSACEGDIASLRTRMSTAEGKISTLEGKVATAEADIVDLKSRTSALENADIMDAVMLSDVVSVTPDTDSVRIEFAKDAYTDGAKSAGTDVADVPQATTSLAGVMIPSDKQKLNAFSVDGAGNAVFSGRVSGDDPTGGADFCTKDYVDSLAISGSASVTVSQSAVSVNALTHGTVEATLNRIVRYGKMRELQLSFRIITDRDYSQDANVLILDLADAGDVPAIGGLLCVGKVQTNAGSNYVGACSMTRGVDARITLTNNTGAVLPSGSDVVFHATACYIAN